MGRLRSYVTTCGCDRFTAQEYCLIFGRDCLVKRAGLLTSIARALERSLDAAKLTTWHSATAAQWVGLTPRQKEAWQWCSPVNRFLDLPTGGQMHYYLDAEFNGFGGSLISLALVPKDRLLAPFYEALPCASPVPWVVKHVLPVLRTRAISRSEMSAKLSSYLHDDLEPVVVSDWPEDIAQLAMLMITGPGWRLPSPRLTFELLDLPLFDSETTSEVPHNACHDAIALRAYMQEFISP